MYIIKHEFYKLFKRKLLWIFAALGLLFTTISLMPIGYWLAKSLTEGHPEVPQPEAPAKILGYQAFSGASFPSVLFWLVPFLVIALFAYEYSHSTFRNILTTKAKRTEVYISKYVVMILSIYLIILFYAVVSAVIVSIVNGWGSSFSFMQILDILALALRIGLVYIFYSSLFIFLSLFIHNSAGLIGIFIGLSIFESTVISLLNSVSHNNKFLDYLLYISPYKYSQQFSQLSVDSSVLTKGLIASFIMIIVFFVCGYYVFKHQDIHS